MHTKLIPNNCVQAQSFQQLVWLIWAQGPLAGGACWLSWWLKLGSFSVGRNVSLILAGSCGTFLGFTLCVNWRPPAFPSSRLRCACTCTWCVCCLGISTLGAAPMGLGSQPGSHPNPTPIPSQSHPNLNPIPIPSQSQSHANPMPIPCPSQSHPNPIPIPIPSQSHPNPGS